MWFETAGRSRKGTPFSAVSTEWWEGLALRIESFTVVETLRQQSLPRPSFRAGGSLGVLGPERKGARPPEKRIYRLGRDVHDETCAELACEKCAALMYKQRCNVEKIHRGLRPTSALGVQMADRESLQRRPFCALRRSRTVATPASRKIVRNRSRENVDLRDVTHDCIDLDARLRNAQAEEAQHLQILKRARRSKTYSRAQRTQQRPGGESSNSKAKKSVGPQIDMSFLGNPTWSEQKPRCGNSLAATSSR